MRYNMEKVLSAIGLSNFYHFLGTSRKKSAINAPSENILVRAEFWRSVGGDCWDGIVLILFFYRFISPFSVRHKALPL